jgi:hypothetical protein
MYRCSFIRRTLRIDPRAQLRQISRKAFSFDAGVPWEALYTLEQQADGSLKITGCTLLKAGQAA